MSDKRRLCVTFFIITMCFWPHKTEQYAPDLHVNRFIFSVSRFQTVSDVPGFLIVNIVNKEYVHADIKLNLQFHLSWLRFRCFTCLSKMLNIISVTVLLIKGTAIFTRTLLISTSVFDCYDVILPFHCFYPFYFHLFILTLFCFSLSSVKAPCNLCFHKMMVNFSSFCPINK